MSQMFNPPHPGETLKDDVLPALGLSVTEAAAQNVPLADTMAMTGHRSISSVVGYYRPSGMSKAAKLLDD